MKNTVLGLALLILLASSGRSGELGQGATIVSETDIQPANSRLLFQPVEIILRSGEFVSGALLGITEDAVVVKRKGEAEKVGWRKIRSLVIEFEASKGSQMLSTMLLGTYVGNLIWLRARNQPPFYMERHDDSWLSLVLKEALLVGAGSGLGLLAGGIMETGRRAFEFTGEETKDLREWRKVAEFILGSAAPPRVHLSVQAASVPPRIFNRYSSVFKDAGYWVYPWGGYSWFGETDAEPASTFNLLRRAQLSLSLSPKLEVGAAMIWLSEPSVGAWKQVEYQPTPQLFELQQSYSSTGYYLIGSYRPLSLTRSGSVSWNIGLGVGAVKNEVDVQAKIRTYLPGGVSDEQIKVTASRWQFSALAFTELRLSLTRGFSLGLLADYIWAPSIRAGGIPEAGIPDQKLRGTSASVGITLGLHI